MKGKRETKKKAHSKPAIEIETYCTKKKKKREQETE
jgi:hypothetical protein